MKSLLLLLFITTLNTGWVYSQSKSEKKKLKQEKAVKDYEGTKTWISSKNYSFVASAAYTQQGRRIDLTTRPNYLKIDQNKADIYLPYYGEVHSSSIGLNDEGGIIFKGTIKDYKVEFNDKKLKAVITFKAVSKNDNFDFTLTVLKKGGGNLVVYSNIRSSINYDGELRNLTSE